MIENSLRPKAICKRTPGMEKAASRLEALEVRSFEAEYVNQLWHLDFHQASRRVIDASGNWHAAMALCVLDDRSRLCCHLQWFINETAEALFHGLMQAFHKRGLPRGLMSDNGAAMIAHETQNGLTQLGINHDRTLPYSPYHYVALKNMWRPVPRAR